MIMVISGNHNGRTEQERARLVKRDWESRGYKVKCFVVYNYKTHRRNTELHITAGDEPLPRGSQLVS